VQQGVLTIALGSSLGSYVLNKQGPNRQIWWSSPVSGPKRFEWSETRGAWVSTRDASITLTALLREELRQLARVDLSFPPEGDVARRAT
jgi:frataxin